MTPLNEEEDARIAYQRRRAWNIGLGVVAAVAVFVTGVLFLRQPRGAADPEPTAKPVADMLTQTPPYTLNPTLTGTPRMDTPTPTATARVTTTTRPPTPTKTTPTGSYPPPPEPAPAGLDLHVSAPATVTLTFDGTVYRGQLKITVANPGPPYEQTHVYLTFPSGVGLDSANGFPFISCSSSCQSDGVPAGGGVRTYVIGVKANYAAQASDVTLGNTVAQVVSAANGYPEYIDPTPGDNTVTVSVVLAKP